MTFALFLILFGRHLIISFPGFALVLLPSFLGYFLLLCRDLPLREVRSHRVILRAMGVYELCLYLLETLKVGLSPLLLGLFQVVSALCALWLLLQLETLLRSCAERDRWEGAWPGLRAPWVLAGIFWLCEIVLDTIGAAPILAGVFLVLQCLCKIAILLRFHKAFQLYRDNRPHN